MTSSFNGKEAGAFFVVTIALALGSWPVSFALGAYGEVFYTSVLTIWVASLAALFAGAVIGKTTEGEAYFTWWGLLLLLIPTLSLSSGYWSQSAPVIASLAEWGILLSLPYIAYILLTVSTQEAFDIQDKRLIFWVVVGFLGLNTLSYAAGVFNYTFLTCDDFIVAGDQAPNNCWSLEPKTE
ncbi:hypothetical protein [Loktanella sp. Alg231-35]|uniref:hypothetical protein n=1 Tax=Loktanella sp. Alg231-35 TaxID=1922220 RepID=UPI000D556B89|nr:hypothetical protein [Loktanella sp. Alg231-35]